MRTLSPMPNPDWRASDEDDNDNGDIDVVVARGAPINAEHDTEGGG